MIIFRVHSKVSLLLPYELSSNQLIENHVSYGFPEVEIYIFFEVVKLQNLFHTTLVYGSTIIKKARFFD